MRCERAQAILIPADEPRIADEDVLRALEHAEHCPRCRAWIESDLETAEWIRRAAPRPRAPREVRDRLFEMLARERASPPPAPSRPPARTRLAVAAAAVFALVAALLWILRPAPEDAGSIFVQDYVRKAVEQEAIRSSNPEMVSAFLMRELGAAIRPPSVRAAQLAGAEVCLLDGQRGALLTYVMEGRPLSFYVVPKRGRIADLARGDPTPVFTLEGTLKVILWSDDRFAYAVVGEQSADDLQAFARAARGY